MHTDEDSSGCELQLGHSLGESSANGVTGFSFFLKGGTQTDTALRQP